MSATDRMLDAANQRYGSVLQRIPPTEWPPAARTMARPPREVWRSATFLVQIYQEGLHARLTVCRTALGRDGVRWMDGITWDDLQRLKRECGRGEQWAVECYPPDTEIVNDANMRHLWLIAEPPYGWKRGT